MSKYSNLWKSISKTGTNLAKEGLKEAKKHKKEIITGVATGVVAAASKYATNEVNKSGFSFFRKPYYIAFKTLKPEDIDKFKNQMVELGYKIQLMYSRDDDNYYGKILNYFHSVKRADKFTYKLPLGLAEYYVTELDEYEVKKH
ncbi:MAG: hypothetical protein EPN82_02555 [Bacteroidetes bacterium]|nr:MAG: hypothetical protein EPN82_02555 [Bacteroidota bacterium]